MNVALCSLAFIEGIGGPEMVMIVIIVLVLFGGKKLPEFARGLGKSLQEFKRAASGVEDEFKRALADDASKNYRPNPPATVPALTDMTPSPDADQIDYHAAPPAPAAPQPPAAEKPHGRADV